MKEKNKLNLVRILIVGALLLSVINVSYSVKAQEIIGDLQVLNRTAESDNYINVTSNETLIHLYTYPINIMNLSGSYIPYGRVTNFTQNETQLTLSWNNNSVSFIFYIINQSGYKQYLGNITPLESEDLGFSTTISDGRGSYHYYHNMTSVLENQPTKLGYQIITNNVSCYRRHKELVCGDQKIDFSESIDYQNLTVDINETNVEFSGFDLSFIDPQVILDQFDFWNSWGVWQNVNGCEPPNYDEQRENGGTGEIEVGVNDKTCGQEIHRSYFAYTLSDIDSSWIINSVSFEFYPDFIDYSWSSTTCDQLNFHELIYTDVGDWTPNTEAEASAIWNAIDNRAVYILDNNVNENTYNTELFSSQATTRLNSDVSNRYPFFIGFRHDVSSATQDCYIDIDNEVSINPPRLIVSYTVPDQTPPITSASATSPPGGAPYTFGSIANNNIQINLSCTDTGGNPPNPSGCAFTRYCLDTVNSCVPVTTYSFPLTAISEGTTYLRFFSVDNRNNIESTQNRSIIIERNYPVNVSVKINDEEIFSYEGVFQTTDTTNDFVQELNGALYNCTADAEGYCIIPITVSSTHAGAINITNINLYYDIEQYLWNISTFPELSTYRARLRSTDGYFNSNYSYSTDFTISSTLILPNDTNRFIIQNSSASDVAWLGDSGNIVLKGTCSISTNCVAPDGSLIIANSTDDSTAYIDLNGNLCLESGSCTDMAGSCNPTRDAFIIQNTTGYNMSYIDFNGNLCLTGGLYQNAVL